MKQIMFFVIATVVVIFLVATGCTKNPNPAGPGPACALCAQETQTAEAGKATATPTNNVVVNATPTVTKTPTNVAGNSTATITPTSTATSTATATQTSTPAIEEVVLKISGGTSNATFSITWSMVNTADGTVIETHSSPNAVCDSEGNWVSNPPLYHVVDGQTELTYSGQSPATISGTCTLVPCNRGTGFTITVETTYLGVVHDNNGPEVVPANHSFGPTGEMFY